MLQGIYIGPVAFLVYTSAIVNAIGNDNIKTIAYADDTQLYLSCRPNQESLSQNITLLEQAVSSIRRFMLTHNLKINDSKTEFLIIGSKHSLNEITSNNIKISVGQCEISPAETALNLGVYFDSKMSMTPHINNITKKSYFQLIKIHQIKKYLTKNVTESLIHSFITSNLDYCNSLLVNLPKKQISKLQKVQNAAARLITNSSRFTHITPILRDLHWLPVNERVTYKILILVFKCLHGMAPSYLSSKISSYEPRRPLRSQNKNLLVIPEVDNNYGKRSFYFAGPSMWNSLPESLRSLDSLSAFKSRLKAHLFRLAYL